MSKAFTREDVDPPERSGRVRSASGLPPGASNYITARGARRLQHELAQSEAAGDGERIAELQRILASIVVIDSAEAGSDDVAFGSTVTVERPDGTTEKYTVLGVDELSSEPDSVSWISPIGKSLLSARLGDRVIIGGEILGRITKVEPGEVTG